MPPLRLPQPDRAWRFRHFRFLAPVAAAAAVVALALGLASIGGARAGHPGTTSGTSGPGLGPGFGPGFGPVTAGPPVARLVAEHVVPPYFVQVAWDGNQNAVATGPTYADVRATATGAILGKVAASQPGYTVLAVTAAADDRTFVLDEEKWISDSDRSQNSAYQTRSFYLLRLGGDGRVASVTRLPMTAGKLVTGLALSPDGTRLALAVEPLTGSDPNRSELRVYTLATGSLRTWVGDGTIGASEDDTSAISWTDSGQLLLGWAGKGASGSWLLDPARPGTSLLGSGRWVISSPSSLRQPLYPSALRCDSGTITLDGSGLVCAAVIPVNQRMSGHGLRRDAEIAYFKYSVATGKLAGTLAQWSVRNVLGLAGAVLWTNASGSVVIGAIPDGGEGRIGVIADGKFSQLNGRFYGTW
jgi:hypothetical protein